MKQVVFARRVGVGRASGRMKLKNHLYETGGLCAVRKSLGRIAASRAKVKTTCIKQVVFFFLPAY